MDWSTESLQEVKPDPEAVLEDRCAYYDFSAGGRGHSTTPNVSPGHKPLAYGRETLFVNASVNTVKYQPVNAPFLVDLDLPANHADVH